MKTNTDNAKYVLNEGGYTCVLCKEDEVFTSKERGIKPLVLWYDSGKDFSGFSAADKVVGKAAAMMYVLMKVDQVYAYVMSKGAVEIFERFGVKYFCDVVTAVIINRTSTGACPMEKAVSECEEPEEAYEAVKNKLAELAVE